jgi:CHAT domain-containing protein
VTRTGIVATVLPSLDSLGPVLDRFADQLQSGDSAARVGDQLSATLLGPAISQLPAGITRLIIVPDGALHRLPFAALSLGPGQPLIQRFGISLAPSLAVAQMLMHRQAAGAGPILALGDPAFGSKSTTPPRAEVMREAFDDAGGLPRLVASADEARHAAEYAAGSVLRLGEEASEAFLKHTPLTGYRVIHFATHALVDDRTVARTALALAPGGGEDGFVTAGEISQLSLNADLVVLSACRTADGMLVGGEGVQGLTAPFLQAGARSVLATLWPVNDRAAARFEALFYPSLVGGATVGEALRRASEAAIAQGDPASEWAAFVLVGDPTVVVPLTRPTPQWRWGLVMLLAVVAYGVWRVKLRKAEGGPSPDGRTGRTLQL